MSRATSEITSEPMSEDSFTTIVAEIDSIVPNPPPVVRAIPITDQVLDAAKSAAGFGESLHGVPFERSIRQDVLDELNSNPAFFSRTIPRRKSLYPTYVLHQCAIDRRDLGLLLPHVISVDAGFPSLELFVCTDAVSNVVIKNVHSSNLPTLAAAAEIFVQRALLGGQDAQIANDMQVFSNGDYRTIGAWRGDALVGSCVFRAFLTNTGERMIHLELLATRLDASPGVGSALMRVIRKLSQITPMHSGHVAAFTLRNKNTHRFYNRKLPECNGPHSRALIASMLCVDPFTSLYSHLDMRCSVVLPTTV